MFRCITELKGLIVDADSFSEVPVEKWKDITRRYKCLFFVSDESTYREIVDLYGEDLTLKTERFRRLFAPSPATHVRSLTLLGLGATEVAYVSQDNEFLNRAMGFLGAAIWITPHISYEQASFAPDLILRNFDSFNKLMKKDLKGFLGEVAVYPNEQGAGMIIPVEMDVDEEKIPLYMLGRYFGYSHFMNQLHPYSTAIYFNKKEGKAYFGVFNDLFAKLFARAVKNIQNNVTIDGIVAVPMRPGKPERFDRILAHVAEQCGITDYGHMFWCEEDYPVQKQLSSLERQDNVSGVFRCNSELAGKNIVIIDDIITTGSTMKECVRTLKQSGVNEVYIAVLGINQMRGNYWSSEVAQISCPNCGEKMRLLISRNADFFYSCFSCKQTMGFHKGREQLYAIVNNELQDEMN